MNKARKQEEGQAIVILALMMIGLLAFAALAIDGGNAYTERRRAQNGADAAALAGARQLWIDIADNYSYEYHVVSAMNTVASQNGITMDSNDLTSAQSNVLAFYTDSDGNSLGIQVGHGSIPSSAKGIKVTAARQFSAFLGGIIGRGQVGATADATAVLITPPDCGDFAVYGAYNDPGHDVVSVSGGGQGITISGGGLYSGGDTLAGNNVTIENGSILSGGTCGPSDKCSQTGASPVTDGASAPNYNLWDIADFEPGGGIAVLAGSAYHYIDGDLNSITEDGLYYVTGNVQISGGTGTHKVTIVSQGTQKYTGSMNLVAYIDDLLFFSNSTDQSNGAIQISASDATWQGLIYAPNGDVKMSNASNLSVSGAIYGQHVSLSGAGISIVYDPATCPLTRARVVLLK